MMRCLHAGQRYRLHTYIDTYLSPPRHLTELGRNPEDSGGVCTYGCLQKKYTPSEKKNIYLYITNVHPPPCFHFKLIPQIM